MMCKQLSVLVAVGVAAAGCGGVKMTGHGDMAMAPASTDMAGVVADLAMTMNPGDDAAVIGDAAAPGADAAPSPDLAMGATCLPDPMTDGQPCGNGCPIGSGTIPVNDQALGCKCWYSCTPMQNTCPCGRRCEALYSATDMGLKPNGMGACIPANGGGERCGLDGNKKPYGYGGCQEGALCVNEDQGGKFAYCMYSCAKQADCPTGTTCLGLQNGGDACILNNSEMMAKAEGAACVNGDICAIASLCDGKICQKQCDGPKDVTTCGGGKKCIAMADMNNQKIAAWVCK